MSPTTAIDYGASYTPSCNTGYDIDVSTVIVCDANGAYNPVTLPTCTSTYIYDLLNVWLGLLWIT